MVNGLLIVSQPLRAVFPRIGAYLLQCAAHVDNTLYVVLSPGFSPKSTHFSRVPLTNFSRNFVNKIYVEAARNVAKLDVRCMLSNVINKSVTDEEAAYLFRQVYLRPFEAVFFDSPNLDQEKLKQFLCTTLPAKTPDPKFVELDIGNGNDETCPEDDGIPLDTYGSTCIGGTFDRLHNGHRVLISEACLLAQDRFICGVTQSDSMLAGKSLADLIQPTVERIAAVDDFVREVKLTIGERLVEPIDDIYGPSTREDDVGCLVASPETRTGVQAVNRRRVELGKTPAAVRIIDYLPDKDGDGGKLSSSDIRRALLGRLLRQPSPDPSLPVRPRIIGLTGGIASGKSSVCRRLAGLGAGIVPCDQLGHQAYRSGSDCFRAVVDAFGSDVVSSDSGEIDRRKLGAIVFSDPAKMKKLNSVVWPAIASLAREEIDKLNASGKQVVVLDAAVLLEAGWDRLCHEVWVCFVPRAEAVRRVTDRDGLSEAEARRRLDSQLTNRQRLARAHVPLSTIWEPAVTQAQVETAWSLLQERL